MDKLISIDEKISKLDQSLDELLRNSVMCSAPASSVIAPIDVPDKVKLVQIKNEVDQLRAELKRIVGEKGRLSNKAMELDQKLDKTLSAYFWLWEKCNTNAHGTPNDIEY